MTDDPAATLRDRAREWGRALLAAAPWDALSERVTLIVTAPPTGVEAAPGTVALWLAIDTPSARALPAEYRGLLSDDAVIQRHRASGDLPEIVLTITTDTAADRLLQGVTQRAMEARWQVRHAEVVTDRLRRAENFALRAGMLPDDGPERILRGLWVEAHAAARAFPAIAGPRGAEALGAAGELVAALCRIACFMDDGAYPPSEWLLVAARPTRIGKRIGAWIDGVVPALGGDAAAARRVASSLDQVIAEVQEVLAERYRGRPWLTAPEAFALRAPR